MTAAEKASSEFVDQLDDDVSFFAAVHESGSGTKRRSGPARPYVRSRDRCGRDRTRALCELGRS